MKILDVPPLTKQTQEAFNELLYRLNASEDTIVFQGYVFRNDETSSPFLLAQSEVQKLHYNSAGIIEGTIHYVGRDSFIRGHKKERGGLFFKEEPQDVDLLIEKERSLVDETTYLFQRIQGGYSGLMNKFSVVDGKHEHHSFDMFMLRYTGN